MGMEPSLLVVFDFINYSFEEDIIVIVVAFKDMVMVAFLDFMDSHLEEVDDSFMEDIDCYLELVDPFKPFIKDLEDTSNFMVFAIT